MFLDLETLATPIVTEGGPSGTMDRMLNWLVIGVGDITTRRVLPAILAEPRSTLAGIVTRDPAKAAPYNVPAWTDLERALAESGADAVYVATPVFLHAPQTIASLRAGRHVLCEKPMALDYAEARSMVEAAEISRPHAGGGLLPPHVPEGEPGQETD